MTAEDKTKHGGGVDGDTRALVSIRPRDGSIVAGRLTLTWQPASGFDSRPPCCFNQREKEKENNG